MFFGQIVFGPPGSGKTTYCDAMASFLNKLGRKTAIVNIDPANENVPYKPDVDIADLVQLEEVMDSFRLGPNGGLIYCMEYLEKNFDWLLDSIRKLRSAEEGGGSGGGGGRRTYFIIDCPGQVELYTHNNAMKSIVKKLETEAGLRLCAVHLVDSHYCAEPSKFVAVCLTSLTTMLQMELPHVNVLSKADLIEKYGRLDFNVDFYTEVLDLDYIVGRMSDDPFAAKFKWLNRALTDLISNHSLVNFLACTVKSKESMMAVRDAADKANGYCFSSVEEANTIRAMAFSSTDFEYAKTMHVRENYMASFASDEDGEDDDRTDGEARSRRLGNDLDLIDMGPGFQI